jgi:hypothetical protein
MTDELDTILRLVAEGRLTPEQAAPIIEALSRPGQHGDDPPEPAAGTGDERRLAGAGTTTPSRGRSGRQLRIRVTERGRQVVNLRIPLAFAGAALRGVPGLGEEQASRIRAAIDANAIGPIVDVEDDSGSGVLITLE